MPAMSAEARVLDLACARLRALPPASLLSRTNGVAGIDVMGDQEQTLPPDTGGARCMRMVPETQSRFVHAFLPHSAWVHTAAAGVLVLSLTRREASPSGSG